jgi:hypothetical protein
MPDSILRPHQLRRPLLRVRIISFSSLNFNSNQTLVTITRNGQEEEDKERRES